MTKEELAGLIKTQVKLSFEELMKDIEPNMMDEVNNKIAELEKKQENKLLTLTQDVADKSGKEGGSTWPSLGEQLRSVAMAGAPGAVRDKRLVWQSFKDVASGSNSLVGAEGGFLISPEYSNTLIALAHETGIVAKDCRHLPISGNRIVLNALKEVSRANGSRWGGLLAYWVSEAGTATATKPALRTIDLKLNKLMGVHYSTEELLEDTVALEALVRQGFGEEFSFLIDNGIIDGSGAGKPRGILGCNALVTVS